MRPSIKARGVELTPRLRQHIEKKLLRPLRRLETRLTRVDVTLESDVQHEVTCRVIFHTAHAGVRVSEDSGPTALEAIDRSRGRVLRQVKRHRDRRRARWRRRLGRQLRRWDDFSSCALHAIDDVHDRAPRYLRSGQGIAARSLG